MAFHHPELQTELSRIFRRYTGNRIPLADAIRQIEQILPQPITAQQMDAYLADAYATYAGVPELIEWCLRHDILFMINTTGMIGYFQRVFANKLLPRVPVLSAHPMVRYVRAAADSTRCFELNEIQDKSQNTAAAVRAHAIPADRIILLGDSGGDGPHFDWGSKTGAFLIGSMTKPSLADYCRTKNIRIDLRFGIDFSKQDQHDVQDELQVNFMDLAPVIERFVNR